MPNRFSLKLERNLRILNLFARNPSTSFSVEQVHCKFSAVHERTIRRDLNQLHEMGLIELGYISQKSPGKEFYRRNSVEN